MGRGPIAEHRDPPPEKAEPRRSFRRRRRIAASVAALVVLVLLTSSCLMRRLGGAFTHAPEEWRTALSPAALELLERSFADLPGPPVDYHTHLVGLGDSGSGAWVNPRMRSWLHPVPRFKFSVYLSACGVEDVERADAQFLERLVALARSGPRPALHGLLAFDRNHRADGGPDDDASEFHVPNDYVFDVVARHPGLFAPVASIHPYRTDAIAELERCAGRGARMIKWIPAAMGIDPADPRCDPFYDRMRELGVALLTHAGREEAIDAEAAQRLGNPLRLRRPLERGVKVVVAHCASLGEDEDLDDPARPHAESFDLFLRMMGEERHRGLLFGELSAISDVLRDERPFRVLLERADLHGRLVNGSDYPIPAVNVLVWTGDFADWGFITEEEEELLDEIYGVNPLLFDFALKRALKHPRTGARFPPSVFVAHPELPLG